jgi:hypothetical protein
VYQVRLPDLHDPWDHLHSWPHFPAQLIMQMGRVQFGWMLMVLGTSSECWEVVLHESGVLFASWQRIAVANLWGDLALLGCACGAGVAGPLMNMCLGCHERALHV